MIHVFGDSHVNFFTGSDELMQTSPQHKQNQSEPFYVHWLGPALAYKLENRIGEIAKLSKEFMQAGDEGLLVFGEIDCRCQILKHKNPRETVEDAVKRCVQKYVNAAHLIRIEAGGKWSFFGPVCSTPGTSVTGVWFDTVGTSKERNEVTDLFNRHLKAYAVTHNFGFVSIFHKLVDKDLNSNRNYFRDEIHINQKAWPLFKAEWEKTR
jgi:hypothetical protein